MTRTAGVRLKTGAILWVDAGDWNLELLNLVVVRHDGMEITGSVCVLPDQLIRSPGSRAGRIVQVISRE
jgi:hypothetical protein